MRFPGDQVPYSDPIRDDLDLLESSIERSFEVLPRPWFETEDLMDSLGLALDAVEAGIEGTVIPPTEPVRVELPPVEPMERLLQQDSGKGPPPLPAPGRHDWIALQPPLAARPYFTQDGLAAPSYQPRGGRGAGIRNETGQRIRWCPKEEQTVDEEEECPSCDEFSDHGDGVEQCLYDWLEENREPDGAEEGDDG